uniref:Rho-GAP domain-containing protein n=1 Tax=Macrostomum lignano TaxID=282301 RepID=A0A1I8GWQ0_9PLAT
MSAGNASSDEVQQRRPLSTFQQSRPAQQPKQQQKIFRSVIDPTFGHLDIATTSTASTTVTATPVAVPSVAAVATEAAPTTAADEAADVAAASLSAAAELSPPDSQLDSRSFDSLTGQLDGEGDGDGEGEREVGAAVDVAEVDDGAPTTIEEVHQGGVGGGASSDEGLISGEDDEEPLDGFGVDDGGSGVVSRGTFRKKFEASLRRKAAADSAEQDRRRCASMAAAMAATSSVDEDNEGGGSGSGVALRSEEVRRRIESTVIQTARASAALPGTGEPAPAAGEPISAGWRVEGGGPSGNPRVFLFGEPSLSLGFLANDAPGSEQQQQPQSQQPPKSARLEISLPIGHIQETRKEGIVRLTKLSGQSGGGKQQSSGKKSAQQSTQQPQLYRLLLTGPDLVFYKADKKASDKKPEFALNVAATEILPCAPTSPSPSAASADAADSETDLRLRYPGSSASQSESAAIDDSLSRYAHLYPGGASSEYLLHWEDPKQRKEWSVALKYAKDLLMQRMYARTAGRPIDWGSRRVSIAQRLNDFFRKRPALNELVDRGIVRNEPVFGSTLRLICQHERSEVPNFLRRCLQAIESHGLDTEGIYRLAGNAATVQKLRLMVDQQEDYDLSVGWDINVLTSALKTFLRELKEPVIPSDTFQIISNHFKSSEKPSVKREAIRQALRSLPSTNYASLRLLCEHLAKVVSQSDQSQMNSRNLALMFGPNLVLPDAAGAGLCPTSNLMYQNQVVEYIMLESSKLFAD